MHWMKQAIAVMAVLASAGGAMSAELAGSEWGIAGEDGAFVQFGGEGRISGKAYCNRFTGSYEADASGSFRAGPLASTKMACPGDLMEKESDFLRRLQSATRFDRDLQLQLLDDDGAVLLSLIRRDPD
ncbi:MAG: META domain-containing protein [Salaquimonas sp.]|jgi:putative lipoprotein|nr:META domain-containing protein [Salaquimonas sp.]